MTVPFLEARFDECRTPRWTDATPVADRMVCGAQALPGRTYCAECRKVLIAGEIRNGRTTWFNGARRTMAIDDPTDAEVTTDQAGTLLGSPTLGSTEVSTSKEAEPEGDRPLLLDVLSRRSAGWGMAA